jgi:hypothetical protein
VCASVDHLFRILCLQPQQQQQQQQQHHQQQQQHEAQQMQQRCITAISPKATK